MTGSIQTVNTWEFRIALVHFEESAVDYKSRPILVLGKEEDIVVALKVTSKLPPTRFPSIKLDDWEECGLVKPSWLQLEPAFKVKIENVRTKIGEASEDLRNTIYRYITLD